MKKTLISVLATAVMASGAVLASGGGAHAAGAVPVDKPAHYAHDLPITVPQIHLAYLPTTIAGAKFGAAVITKPFNLPGQIRIRMRGPAYQKFGAGHLFQADPPTAGEYTIFVHYIPAEGAPFEEATASFPLQVVAAPAA